MSLAEHQELMSTLESEQKKAIRGRINGDFLLAAQNVLQTIPFENLSTQDKILVGIAYEDARIPMPEKLIRFREELRQDPQIAEGAGEWRSAWLNMTDDELF